MKKITVQKSANRISKSLLLGIITLSVIMSTFMASRILTNAAGAKSFTKFGFTIETEGVEGVDYSFSEPVLDAKGSTEQYTDTSIVDCLTVLSSKPITISGSNAAKYGFVLYVKEGVTANVTLKDCHINADNLVDHSPVTVDNNAKLNLTLDGANSISNFKQRNANGYESNAAIWVRQTAELVIDESENGGSLTANAYGLSAVIGGSFQSPDSKSGKIVINGGRLNLTSDGDPASFTEAGALIGAASRKGMTEIEINGGEISGYVENGGAAIGYGFSTKIYGSGAKITINGGRILSTSWNSSILDCTYNEGDALVGAAVNCDASITVNGGYIKGSFSKTPVSNGKNAYKVTATIQDAVKDTPVTEIKYMLSGEEHSYLTNGVSVLDAGKIVMYLPEKAILTKIQIGDTVYNGSFIVTNDETNNTCTFTASTGEYSLTTVKNEGTELTLSKTENIEAGETIYVWLNPEDHHNLYGLNLKNSSTFSGEITGVDSVFTKVEGEENLFTFEMPSFDAYIYAHADERHTANFLVGGDFSSGDIENVTVTVKKNGSETAYFDTTGTIVKLSESYGILAVNLPDGTYDVTIEKDSEVLLSVEEVQMQGTSIDIGFENAGLDGDLYTFDLSFGDIVINDENGKVTGFGGNGVAKSLPFASDATYKIIQSDTTETTNQVRIQNAGTVNAPVKVEIDGLNMISRSETVSTSYAESCIKINDSAVNIILKRTNNLSQTTGKIATRLATLGGENADIIISGNGALNISAAGYGAAIGSCFKSDLGNPVEVSGSVTINSGTIHVLSYLYGAGIGAGRGGNETVTINGGTITVNGDSSVYAAGIGGGYTMNGNSEGTVNIHGGDVTVTCSGIAAGIGGGYSNSGGIQSYATGNVNITGGTVHVYASGDGAGIGGGRRISSGSNASFCKSTGNVNISGGDVYVTQSGTGSGIGCGRVGVGSVNISGGNVSATVVGTNSQSAAIGGAYSTNGVVTITGGTVIATNESSGAAIGGGGSGNGNVTIVDGTVTASNTGAGPAIGGNSLGSIISIEGGTVHADSVDYFTIGGSKAKISISNGTVNAQVKGSGSAAIGGTDGTSVDITGGIVTAEAKDQAEKAAGIGGVGTVNISGGQITASTKGNGAAIGSRNINYSACTVTIFGGTVYASSEGSGSPFVNSSSYNVSTNKFKVSGGSIHAIGTMTTPAMNPDLTQKLYPTTLSLGASYANKKVNIGSFKVDGESYEYGTNDLYADENGAFVIYLPACENARCTVDGSVYQGAVTADTPNELLLLQTLNIEGCEGMKICSIPLPSGYTWDESVSTNHLVVKTEDVVVNAKLNGTIPVEVTVTARTNHDYSDLHPGICMICGEFAEPVWNTTNESYRYVYETPLSKMKLPKGWAWVNESHVPTVTASTEQIYLDVSGIDEIFDYSSDSCYDAENHRIIREVSVKVMSKSLASNLITASITYGDQPEFSFDLSEGVPDNIEAENFVFDGTDQPMGFSMARRSDTTFEVTLRGKPDAGTVLEFYFRADSKNPNYSISEIIVQVTVTKKDISGANILLGNSLTFDGTNQAQTVDKVYVGPLQLNENDYDISGNENTLAGTHTLKITGKGNYTGEASKEYTIARKDISDMSFTLAADSFVYNGKEQSVSVSSSDADVTYEVKSGSAGTAAGPYELVVEGTGNYCGTVSLGWEITPCSHLADPTYVVDIESTCKTPGTKHKECSLCGTVLEENIELPLSEDHVFDQGVITKEATTELEGVKTYTCTVCETTKTEVIPKLEVKETESSEESKESSSEETKPSESAEETSKPSESTTEATKPVETKPVETKPAGNTVETSTSAESKETSSVAETKENTENAGNETVAASAEDLEEEITSESAEEAPPQEFVILEEDDEMEEDESATLSGEDITLASVEEQIEYMPQKKNWIWIPFAALGVLAVSFVIIFILIKRRKSQEE